MNSEKFLESLTDFVEELLVDLENAEVADTTFAAYNSLGEMMEFNADGLSLGTVVVADDIKYFKTVTDICPEGYWVSNYGNEYSIRSFALTMRSAVRTPEVHN